MSDTANAATTSTLYANFRTRLREVCTCTIEATGGGVTVSWSKWRGFAKFTPHPQDPHTLRIIHVETAVTEAVGRLTKDVWNDYVEIVGLLELK